MIELGTPYPPSWNGEPPGLLWLERDIWKRYIEKHAEGIRYIYYSVRIPQAKDIDEKIPPGIAMSWKMLTSLRIDAVVVRDNEVEIVEVRPNAGRSPLGAVMTYLYCWQKEPPIQGKAVPTIVTDTTQDIYYDVYAHYGVRMYVV